MAEAEGHSLLNPELVLFMSVDLAGSTAYKQEEGAGDGRKPWLLAFRHFHEGFSTFFYRNLLDADSSPKRPSEWKRIGDEIVYTAVIDHPSQMAPYLLALRGALRSFRTRLREKEVNLDVKGACWLAGVPVANAKFITTVSDAEGKEVELIDYLGPHIDIGFRIGSRATPRRLVVSVEIAYMLSVLNDDERVGVELQFERGEPLKGVFRQANYPTVWIDTFDLKDDLEVEEELLADAVAREKPEHCPWPELNAFTSFYINRYHDGAFFHPFCANDPDRFPEPEGYRKALELAKIDLEESQMEESMPTEFEEGEEA